ncbi:MAG: toll/interleukin-1 receptor domain-containing protein [bacterium]|nr:toll/interleukin-1 receptor domain-containing protein [bacterium]
MTKEEYNEKLKKVQIASMDEFLSDLISEYIQIKKEYPESSCIENGNKGIFCLMIKRLYLFQKQHYNNGICDMNFAYEDFSKADFSMPGGSDNSGMIFIRCNLFRADFEAANLDAIEFYDCNLSECNFTKAFLECSGFWDCNMHKVNMRSTHMLASYIDNCDWSECYVEGANLLEMTGKNVDIKGMNIDNCTSINDGDFEGFDWHEVNVAGLSISIDQIAYFNDCVTGGEKIAVYDDYKRTTDVEDEILISLLDDKNDNSVNVDESESYDVFISFSRRSDGELVEEIKQQYVKDKRVWICDEALDRNQKLKKQIDQVIHTCKEAVIILSDQYRKLAWTRYEAIKLYQEYQKRNIQIIIFVVHGKETFMLDNILNCSDHIIDFRRAIVVNLPFVKEEL